MAAAACMTGTDPAKILRLPCTEGMKNEIIHQRAQDNFFTNCFRTAGATIVEVGHAYPVWLGFVGGKGLASALGFAVALMPWAGLIGFAVAGGVFVVTRRFLPTIVTAAPAIFILAPFTGVPWATVAVALGVFLLVALKRVLDEPRMRRIEAETGWDRERGGSRR